MSWNLHAIFQDVGLQAVITEFLIRCSNLVFAPSVPSVLGSQAGPAHCIHCCCHCGPEQAGPASLQAGAAPAHQPHSVTFAPQTEQLTSPGAQQQLKPVLKQTGDFNTKKVELRAGAARAGRPRPRSLSTTSIAQNQFCRHGSRHQAGPAIDVAVLFPPGRLQFPIPPQRGSTSWKK